MQKNCISSIIICFLLISCQTNSIKKNHYIVKCDSKGIFDGVRAYLKSTENGKEKITDTAMIANGAFEFKGKVNNPEMRILTIDGVVGQTAFVLESGETKVEIFKDSIYKSIIQGGENNKVFNKYKEGYQNIVDKVTSLREEYMIMRNNTEAVKEIQRRNVELREEMKNYGLNFLMQYPETNFSLMLLESITQQKEFDAKLANEILIKIPKSLLKNKYNIDKEQKISLNINNTLNQVKIEIGSIAPDFTAPDPDGNSVTLSKVLGKITILDFWASWCAPCRVENPFYVYLNTKFKTSEFQIVGVSLDRDKESWKNAIKTDGLVDWIHISHTMFWNEPIARLYNITQMPTAFILDSNKPKLLGSGSIAYTKPLLPTFFNINNVA